MSFHAYTRPTNYVALTTLTRSGFVFDADRVSTSTRLYLAYDGGPVRETFTRVDGDTLRGQVPEIAPRSDVKWDLFSTSFTIDTGKAKSSATGKAVMLLSGNFNAGIYRVDYDVSVDVKVSATKRAGLAVRGVSDSNVGAFVYLDGTALCVKATLNDQTTVLLTGATPIVAGTTYTLRVVVAGDTHTVYLDGVSQGSFTNSVNNTTGKGVGLYVNNDTGARWDNFIVTANIPPAATSYSLRNYDGDVLATGSVSGATIDIADSVLSQRSGRGPYGWYRLYLYGPDRDDGQWEDSYGAFSFYRVATDAHFPANPARTQAVAGHPNTDEYARAVMAIGPNRYAITSPAAGASTSTVDTIETAATTAKTMWVDNASDHRARKTLVAFPQGTAGAETQVTAIVNRLKTWVKAWEGFNEPGLETSVWGYPPTDGSKIQDYIDDELVPFYNAVKAADASAVVLAPNPVTINFSNYGTRWLRKFCELTAGMSPIPYDAISVHVYNAFNGDLSMGQSLMAETLDILSDNGLTSKALWQTEQGYAYQYAGLYTPRFNGRWTMLQVFLQELFGLPLEQNFYWYDTYSGFATFPFHWLSPEGPGPSGLLLRTMVAETYGKAMASRYDFGTYGTALYAGGRWDADDGSKTIGLMAASNGARALTLNVSGASSLTCVDPWGNTFTISAVGGTASFPVCELPQWVRVPAGVTVTPASLGLTSNLAEAATVTSTGNQNKLSKINNATQENAYQFEDSSFTNGSSPYYHSPANLGDSAFPVTVTLTWASPQTVSRILLYSFPPWQEQGCPTDFDIDTFDGSTWTTRYSHPLPTSKTFAFTTSDAKCKVETYWDDQWVFDVSFSAASITKIRVVVRACSYGGHESAASHFALWDGNGSQSLVIREIQAFSDSTPPQIVSPNGRRSSPALLLLR